MSETSTDFTHMAEVAQAVTALSTYLYLAQHSEPVSEAVSPSEYGLIVLLRNRLMDKHPVGMTVILGAGLDKLAVEHEELREARGKLLSIILKHGSMT